MHAHMERFDEVASRILRSLYVCFPASAYPDPTLIGLTEEKPNFENGRLKASEEWEKLNKETSSALAWLVDENFVLSRSQGIGFSYVITSKGLKALEHFDDSCKTPRIV